MALFFLSATGLSWSQLAGENITALREAMRWETPTASAQAHHHGGHFGHHGHDPDAADVGLDQVLASARGVGITYPVEIQLPAAPDSAYVVQQTGREWPSKQDAAVVDQPRAKSPRCSASPTTC